MKTKKIHVEFFTEGSAVRAIVEELKQLKKEKKIFAKITPIGSRKYAFEYRNGIPDKHPLNQPARGLVRNLLILIGDSPETGETPRSLEAILKEALAYADTMDNICVTVAAERQRKYPAIPFGESPSSRHIHLRSNLRTHHHNTNRQNYDQMNSARGH